MSSATRRRTCVVLLVLLVGFAGCTSMPGTGGASPTATGGTTATAGEATTSGPGASTVTGTGSDAGSGTTTTTAGTGGGDGDGRSHSNDSATAGTTATATDANATTGQMAVVVDGTRLNLSERTDASTLLGVDADAPDTWQTSDSPTLAAALSSVGVDANATSLSFDGETYRDGRAGTDVVYRVDGEPVDPSEYRLEDGDEVWVLVVTDDTDAETPGEHIPSERLHVHGSMEFVVNGDPLDFGREKWQAASHNSHFHFEGGHADPWHAHSWSVTLAYALSTLEDIDATESGITYNGTTYAYEGQGATATVTVNGESVDPTTYYLTDGDSVRIVLDSDS